MTKKSTVLNISMGIDFVDMLNRWVAFSKRSRSEFIREAVRCYIAKLKKEDSNEAAKGVSGVS